MKIIIYFVVSYFILMGSILSFYSDILESYNKQLTSTQNKLDGVNYLTILHKLTLDTLMYQRDTVVENTKHQKEDREQDIKDGIKEIYTFQKAHPKFHNPTLNKHLKIINNYEMKFFDFYEFFDFINHENYVIGNKTEILFSQNKEQYFLGSLMTHYIPEFFISLGISHNILEEFVEKDFVNQVKNNIYIEHNKLVSLSSDEIANIIALINDYRDTSELSQSIYLIQDLMYKLEEERDFSNNLNNDSLKAVSLIQKADKLINLTTTLNSQNTKLLKKLLKSDEKQIEDKLLFYRLVLILIFLLVSAIFLYFFRIFNSNIKKDKELKELNESLLIRVKKAVNENTKKDQQLIQQSRLAQMGEMISMIAHQWRQPLNAISLTTNNLTLKTIMDDIDGAYFAKELALIDSYSQHLSKTIDDFRTFFKDDKIKDTTSLNKLLLSTLDIVKPSIENKEIKIITDLNCNEKIETYPSEVKQVILNIMKNAEDILLEKKIQDPTIVITTKMDDDNCILLIKDNAGGIPQEIIQKIFDPYFSTKKEKEGTGLGLYMSKTIIEEHCGGKLHVENDEDGAVFSIRLKRIL